MRVYLVEWHAALREALHDALNALADIHVVGACDTAAEAGREIRRLAPDVAVVGDGLADEDHLSLCRRLTRTVPDLRVILHVTAEESCDAVLADLFGASAYVVKQVRPAPLIEALRHAVYPSRRDRSSGRGARLL